AQAQARPGHGEAGACLEGAWGSAEAFRLRAGRRGPRSGMRREPLMEAFCASRGVLPEEPVGEAREQLELRPRDVLGQVAGLVEVTAGEPLVVVGVTDEHKSRHVDLLETVRDLMTLPRDDVLEVALDIRGL